MVKLTRIYTRGGDKGETSLGNGARVAKHDRRVAAYGAVDEANASIGVARLAAGGEAVEMLRRIQNDLFDLGADLCRPGSGAGADGDGGGDGLLRISQSQIDRLEAEIDRINGDLEPLNSFVLPGGTALAAALHMARTITRRAEREMTALAEAEPINPLSIRYINRLSDHLFVLSRQANDGGAQDLLWSPGENR